MFKLPVPPWYKPLNDKLKGAEWVVNAFLVLIAILCILLLFRGDRLSKTAFVVWLALP